MHVRERLRVVIALFVNLACSSPAPPGANRQATEPMRCSIRLTSKGITVDGDALDRDRAVALCQRRTEALVELGEDAGESD